MKNMPTEFSHLTTADLDATKRDVLAYVRAFRNQILNTTRASGDVIAEYADLITKFDESFGGNSTTEQNAEALRLQAIDTLFTDQQLDNEDALTADDFIEDESI